MSKNQKHYRLDYGIVALLSFSFGSASLGFSDVTLPHLASRLICFLAIALAGGSTQPAFSHPGHELELPSLGSLSWLRFLSKGIPICCLRQRNWLLSELRKGERRAEGGLPEAEFL